MSKKTKKVKSKKPLARPARVDKKALKRARAVVCGEPETKRENRALQGAKAASFAQKKLKAQAVAKLEATIEKKPPKVAPPIAVPVGVEPIVVLGVVEKQDHPERKAGKSLVIQRGDYAVFRNRHANYALRLKLDDRLVSFVTMGGGGLSLSAISHDRFAQEFSEQCAYPIDRAAQVFARFGIDAGCTLGVVEHLEKILNGSHKELIQKLRERSAAASEQSQAERNTDGGTMATKTKKVKAKVPSAATAKRTTGGFTEESKLTWLIKENPRSKGGATFARFAKYFGSKTVGEYQQKGGTSGDLRWDVAHKYLTVSK